MKWLSLLFLLPLFAHATNHYVSSSTGSDSNPGTISQPWQTVAKVNSSMGTFVAGDSILFKAGDTFTIPEGVNTGGLLVTVNGIVLSSYGTGAKPILTYPAVTGWTGSGVYTTAFTIQTCCSILFQDGVPLTKASSSACTDGNWYGASGTLYYKPTSGTPSNHTVTVANINNSYIPGIDLSGRQNVSVNGLAFNSLGIGIKTFETTTGTSNLTITNCTFNLCQSGVFMMPGTNNNTGAVIQNNLFYRCQVGVRLYTIAAIGGSSTAGTHINCSVTNNEMSQCGTTDGTTHWQSSVAGTDYEAIGVQNFMSGVISNNNIHDGYCIGLSWYNISTRSSDNNLIQNNTIQNNLKGGMILIGNGAYNYSYNNNLFSNNLFNNSNGAPGNNDGTIAIYPGTLTTTPSKFVNNILSGSLNNIAFENSNAPQFLIENNIISGATNNFVAYGYSSKPASLTMDYNLYYPGTTWILGGNKTLAQMQALGMETHSLLVAPQFISPTNFNLQGTSPAIYAGTNVGLPFTGPAPTLGAFPYVPTNTLCGPFTNHAPIVLTGASNQTISGYSITCNPGAPGISLTNCSNINIKLNSIIGGCSPGQDVLRVGILLVNCSNITVDSNKIVTTATGVYAVNCTGGIVVYGNQMQNMTGPSPRGQAIQFNGCSGANNQVYLNNIENLPGQSQPADAINIYNSNGTSGSNIRVYDNFIRETGTTAYTLSAGGVLLGDGGGSYQSASNNVCVNTGHFGVGIATGTNMSVTNNSVYGGDPIVTNFVAVQIANVVTGSTCSGITVTGNQVNAQVGVAYWIPISGVNACSVIINASNNWTATFGSNILPAVLIPSCPTNKPVISYSPNNYIYYINVPTSVVTPSNSGDPATSWAIVPTLSPGLIFSTTSGQVSGTPTALQAKTTYTVSANNIGGQGSNTVSFTIIDVPPNISYSPSSQTCTLGVAMTAMVPISIGGKVVSYTVSPALPASVTLNTTTGQISGTPSVLSASQSYTVTAFNSGGSYATTITLSVLPPAPAPPIVNYNPSSYILPINVAVSPIVPVSTGGVVASYSISPSLPGNLSFDTNTGIVSGTPISDLSTTPFTITAHNVSGDYPTTLTLSVITVLPNPPSITYNPSGVTLQINIASPLIIPLNSGGTASGGYTISPALPVSMSIDSVTGIISGTPSVLSPAAPYTVVASNTGGMGSFQITISVVSKSPGKSLRVGNKKAFFVN